MLVVEVFPWLSPLWLVQEKNTQFGILVFIEAQEKNLIGNLRGSECDEYCIFL